MDKYWNKKWPCYIEEKMNIYYKIIELYPENHTAVIRFYTDVLTEQILASNAEVNKQGNPIRCRSDISINIPIPIPNDTELEKYILSFAPIEALKRQEIIIDPSIDTTMKSLKKKLNKPIKKTEQELIDILKPNEEPILSNEELEEIITSFNGTTSNT
jgi:hypothetical protein